VVYCLYKLGNEQVSLSDALYFIRNHLATEIATVLLLSYIILIDALKRKLSEDYTVDAS